ncbi:MAG TPA: sigma-54 dependent transcriptional regulator [Azospirillaceae bacterium]|nr:sigma-54 dependent transcriptional regulator [Azospirillaceae bacterium]
MRSRPLVIVVDDEIRSQEAIRRTLDEDFEVLTASSAVEAEALLEREMPHVILCDQRMPGGHGVDFLRRVREQWPDPMRIIISGFTDAPDIIQGVNDAGIHRYITKPWDPNELLDQVHSAARLFQLQRENDGAVREMKISVTVLEQKVSRKKRALKTRFDFERIVRAADSPLDAVCAEVRRIARYDISILITGESGTGKELLARAIHYSSPRADKAFVVQNCGALPDQLLESELFGSRKGAFTGAHEDRIGLFEQADGGTLFLDEIGETSLAFQVKLLRVLQEGEIRPLGAARTRHIDVRVIAATNRDLDAEVAAGRFRGDLYYRLATFPVMVPPLRARPMDVPPLVEHLLAETSQAFAKPIRGLSPEVMAAFQAHRWPGNVRELQNEIQRMVALVDGEMLGPELLSPRLMAAIAPSPASLGRHAAIQAGRTLKEQVEALEERVIREALVRHQGNISRAADELDLSRLGLRSKLKRFAAGRED